MTAPPGTSSLGDVTSSDYPAYRMRPSAPPAGWEAAAALCLQAFETDSPICVDTLRPPPHPCVDVARHSILRLGIPLPTDNPYAELLSPHLFALWHMDKELADSKWEGGSSILPLQLLSAYLSQFPLASPYIKELLDTAIADQSSTDAVAIANTIMKKVWGLRSGQSYLMVGGWTGTPGHAMLYKITRRADNNFDIYIINTGGGSSYHEGITHHHKELRAPVEIIEDIHPCLLCLRPRLEDSNCDFFLRLVRYNLPPDGSTTAPSARSIYENAFGFLASKRKSVATRFIDFRTQQRGGSCTTTVLKAWMAHELGEDFDTWKSAFDFETILVFAKKHEKTWAESNPSLVDELRDPAKLIQADELRRVLRSAARDHLLSLAKRSSPTVALDPEMQKRYATLTQLIRVIDDVEVKVRSKRLRGPNRVTWKVSEVDPHYLAIVNKAVAFRTAVTTETSISLASPAAYLPPHVLSAASFCNSLKQLKEHLTTIERAPLDLSRAYRIVVEKYTEVLPPMTAPFWEEVDPRDLSKSAEILLELLQKYALGAINPRSLHAYEHNTALHLFCALYKMLSRLDATQRNFLANYGVFVGCFRDQMQDRFFTFFHPRELEKRLELLRYLESLPQAKGSLGQFFQDYAFLSDSKSYKTVPDYQLLKAIQDSQDETFQRAIIDAVTTLHTSAKCAVHIEVTEATYLLTEGLIKFGESSANRAGLPAVQLMKATVWLQLFGGYASPPPKEEVSGKALAFSRRYSTTWNRWEIGHTYPHWRQELGYIYPTETIGFSGLHRVEYSALTGPSAEDTIEAAAKTDPLVRRVSDLPSEGKIMVLFSWKTAARIPFEKLLARTQTGSSFQTALLLFFLRENVTRLSQSDAMTLVELMLYKPLLTPEGHWYIPVFEEIFRSPALIAQLQTFTTQGLSLLCDKQSASGFNVYPCLFFIRLNARLQEIFPDKVTFDPLPRLNQWLALETLPPEAVSLIHLHKLMAFYSRPPQPFTSDELVEILTSWMLFNQYPVSPKWKELTLEARASRFIYDLEPAFRELFARQPERLQSFCRKTLTSCGLGDTLEAPWRISVFPCVRVDLSESRWWEMNLTHARISCEAGVLHPGHHEDAKNHPDYKRLFGEEQFLLRKVGSYLTFTHPSYGEIRMRSPPYTPGTWHIYRSKNNLWLQYLPTQHLKTWRDAGKGAPPLPLTLVADHTYWVEPHLHIVIIEPINKEDKRSYRLVNTQLLALEEGVNVSEVKALSAPLFATFEKDPSCIYQLPTLKKVYLDRYRGHDGARLSFTYTSTDRLSWDANPTFVLADDQHRALLGHVPNYLLLSSTRESTSQRLLVPVQRALNRPQTHRALSHFQSLDVEDQGRAEEYRQASEIVCSQRLRYSYFEYDVAMKDADVVITPLHLEGRLFLVYLFLIQRQYVHAKNLLREAFSTETYSNEALEILSWILAASSQHADSSGPNAAIRMRAFLLLDRLQKRPDTTKKPTPEEWQATVKQAIESHKIYTDQIASIPHVLLLYPPEELAFLQSYDRESPRLHKLTQGTYPQDTLSPARRPHRDLTISPFSPRIDVDGFIFEWHEDDLRSENSQKIQDAQERLVRYVNDVSFETSAPPPTQNRGAYFGYIYSLAKKCQTLEEAYALSVRLDCLLERTKSPTSKYELSNFCPALIHFALSSREAPELPHSRATHAEKWRWVHNCYRTYRTADMGRFGRGSSILPPAPESRAPFRISHPTSPPPRTPIEVLAERLQKRESTDPLTFRRPLKETIPTRDMVEAFFSVTLPHASEVLTTTLDMGGPLPPHCAPFAAAIDTERVSFEKDLTAAARARKEKKAYTLKPDMLGNLKRTLVQIQTRYQQELLALEETLLGLARTPPTDGTALFLKEMLTAGETFLPPTVERLINLWLLGDLSAYTKYNPHLNPAQAAILDQLITAYLSRATNSQQVERALALIKHRETAPSLDHANIEELLAETLDAGGHFDTTSTEPHIRPLRVLEYRVNIRIRPQQATLIADLLRTTTANRYNHAIAQMIMGGGKTSVLAAILLYIAAQRGNVSIFLAPVAQFHTLTHTLTTSLYRSFDMPVFTIAMTRQAMAELANLRWVLDTLNEAKEKKGAVLISPTVPQYLQLECLCLLSAEEEAQRDTRKGITDPIRLAKIQTLLRILHILQKESAIHLDEVDVLLNPLLEVNCPLDPPKYLDDSTIDWMRIMFECMVDDAIIVPGTDLSLAQELNLRSATRRFDSARFRSTLMPCLATALVNKYGETKLLLTTPQHQASFVRYVTGQMNADRLTSEDALFLTYLRESSLPTAIPLRKTSAGLIALTKYLGTLVLESTLSRSVGMHYGRIACGHVVPYEGVDAPTSNRFGNPFEAACYYFLTALVKGEKQDRGIHPAQVRMLMTEYRKTAELNVELDNAPSFDQTAEGQECLELTGCNLSTVLTSLEAATAHINENVNRVLRVEAGTIAVSVDFFPHYFSSNSVNFVGSLSTGGIDGSSIRTMSGTPWDLYAYASRLKEEGLLLDVGVEGSIAHVLVAKARTNPTWLHAVADISIPTILDTATAKDPARNIRCIIDAAGLLKDKDSKVVAEETLAYFNGCDHVDTVLYFGRRTPEERPDCLMALKKISGVPVVIIIGSTDPEALKRRDIDINRCITIFDQRHCEATDIPQPRNARALLFFNEHTNRRTLFQSIMRMRQFFKEQSIEFVVQAESRRALVRGGRSPEDILCSALVPQAVAMSKNAVRALRYDLAETPRDLMLKKLVESRDASDRSLSIGLFRQFKPYLLTETTIDPCQFVELEKTVQTSLSLTDHAQALESKWAPSFSSTSTEANLIKAKTTTTLSSLGRNPYLPLEVVTTAAPLGLGTQVQVEMQAEVQVQISTDLSQELQQELRRYLDIPTRDVRPEIEWTAGRCKARNFPRVKASECGISVEPLAHSFKRCTDYAKEYHRVFEEATNLLVSDNWALSMQVRVPVFHPTQKPGQQILVIAKDDTTLDLMLLSVRETEFFKTQTDPNMWVIFSDGTEISSHPHKTLSPTQARLFGKTMLFVHLLNGDVKALTLLPGSLRFVMGEALRGRFLRLRVEGNPVQKNLFYSSQFAGGARRKVFMCERRRDQLAQQTAELKDYSPSLIAKLDPDRVPHLSGEQVRYLTTLDQIQSLTREQIPWVTEVQVPHVLERMLDALTKAEQINAIQPERLKHLATNPQLLHFLTRERIALIPVRDDDGGVIIPQLKREQVPSVPAPLSPYIEIAVLDAATPDQIRHLSTLPVGARGYLSSDRVACFTTQPQIEALSGDALEHLSPDQVGLFPPLLVPGLPDSKIPHLRSREQVQAVSGRRISLLIQQRQIELLSDAQLRENTFEFAQIVYMTAPQLRVVPDHRLQDDHFPSGQVDSLEPHRMAFLHESLLLHLTKPPLIQAIVGDRVRHLISYAIQVPHFVAAQIPYVTVEQVPHIAPALVPNLNDGLLQYLTQAAQIQAVPVERVQHLTDFALQGPHLSAVQVAAAPDGLISYLTTPEAIQAVELQRVHLLQGAYQLSHLSAIQAPHVNRDQALEMPAALLHLIPPNLLSEDRIPEMQAEGVPNLLDEQLRFIRGPVQIQAVQPERVRHLTSFREQIPHLSDDQLEHVTVDQVFSVVPASLPRVPEAVIATIPPHRIPEFTPAHVPFLPNTCLPHLTVEQFSGLTPEQVMHLSTLRADLGSTFVPRLVTEAQIAVLPAPLLTHLNTYRQLTLIPPERIPDLPDRMLKFLAGDDHNARIQAITEDREHFVKRSELPRWRRLREELRRQQMTAPALAPIPVPHQPPAVPPQDLPAALALQGPLPPPIFGVPPQPVPASPTQGHSQPPLIQSPPQHPAPTHQSPQPAITPPVEIPIPQQRLLQNPPLPPQAFLATSAPPPAEKSSFQKIWEDWFAIQARNEKVVHTIRKIMAWTAVVFTAGILLFAIIAIASIHDALKRRRLRHDPPRARSAPQIPRPASVRAR